MVACFKVVSPQIHWTCQKSPLPSRRVPPRTFFLSKRHKLTSPNSRQIGWTVPPRPYQDLYTACSMVPGYGQYKDGDGYCEWGLNDKVLSTVPNKYWCKSHATQWKVRFVHLCLKQLMKAIKRNHSAENQTGPEACRSMVLLMIIVSLQQAFFHLLTPPSYASRHLFCVPFLQDPNHPMTFSRKAQSWKRP